MSDYAHTRARTQRKSPVALDDEKSRVTLQPSTRDQAGSDGSSLTSESASPASAALNDPGYNFGQIAVQPAPAMEPQTKLRVSQPGDTHEQEADRVADAVMRTPAGEMAASGGDTASRTTTSQASAQEAIPGSDGQPLDVATRAYMEPRFGHDFGHVRVHSDEQAAQAASGYHARAYTVGSDIVFGAEQFAPGTSEGQRLLAHELAHVVQQADGARTSGVVQRQPLSSPAPPDMPDDSSSASPGYEERAHKPSIRVHIIAHASPRWRAAENAADADRRNFELSQQRAEEVRSLVETLLARHLPTGTTVNVDVAIDEQEGTVGVTTEARGSRDTLKEAGGNRSDNAQERRRVDVVVDTSQMFEGEAGASRPLLTRPTASKFWHVSVDMAAGASAGAAGSLIELTLTNDNSGQTMTGHVFAGGGGPKASIGVGASVWSDPTGFDTDEPVNFKDFDGVPVRYTTIGAQLFIGYSRSYISFMGLGDGAHSINVSGASVGSVGIGGSVVAGPLSLEGPYPPMSLQIKDTDVTSIPYQRTEHGEDKHTVWFATGSSRIGDAGEESAQITDPEVALLDSFLASVVAATQ